MKALQTEDFSALVRPNGTADSLAIFKNKTDSYIPVLGVFNEADNISYVFWEPGLVLLQSEPILPSPCQMSNHLWEMMELRGFTPGEDLVHYFHFKSNGSLICTLTRRPTVFYLQFFGD